MTYLYSLIIVLPLLGALIIGLGGLMSAGFRKNEGLIGLLGTAAVGIPFLVILYAFFSYPGDAQIYEIFPWMEAGKLKINFSYQHDELSLLMGMIVTGVGMLIHMYSIGYMKGDEGFYKYFTYLNLFIFSMNNLILGDNMVVMFLGWEGVGLCSYLLIGFWYKDMPKANAAQKAFVANRIGDFAMLIAMFMMYKSMASVSEFVNLSFVDIIDHAHHGGFGDNTFWIALLVFIAATGKSAQIPLFVWLPDAMAGPTPVSALIHAATMVTSGIYLIARLHPIFEASPEVLSIIVVVAALTAVIAAFTAIAQNDIKKVLAYSTVSQLGFMFMALGAGAYVTAIFHVMTHAFFKACLFLGSGSVIHAMEHMHTVEDPQDVRTMGGLRKYMPATGNTFWISTLAISGIIPLSGFFSKDEILSSLFFYGEGFDLYKVIWFVALITAAVTAFYMTRVTMLTFEGSERFPDAKKPHESPAIMTIPLWILAGLAVVGGFLGLPIFLGDLLGMGEGINWIGHGWLEHIIHSENAHAIHEHAHENVLIEYGLVGLSMLVAIMAVFLTRNFYRKHGLAGDEKVRNFFGGFYKVMQGKFYFDEFYQRTIIGPFNWLGENVIKWAEENIVDGAVKAISEGVKNIGDVFKQLQSGLVSNYLLIVSLGVLAMLTYLIFG
ncbi:MAG: NADH-quinone oxidoreductase subunit L [Bacteroidia bacterium]|nr:NADH-quinone oxidoreductase subunit L [Bacteroidia bacterium]